MLESQLSGRMVVRSLAPRSVEMIPFWSTLRIMVASTKYISPFLSTAIPVRAREERRFQSRFEIFWVLGGSLSPVRPSDWCVCLTQQRTKITLQWQIRETTDGRKKETPANICSHTHTHLIDHMCVSLTGSVTGWHPWQFGVTMFQDPLIS